MRPRAKRFSFLELKPLAREYERGEAIELLWRTFLDHAPVPSLQQLIEAAATQPRLRQLRPWTSLNKPLGRLAVL